MAQTSSLLAKTLAASSFLVATLAGAPAEAERLPLLEKLQEAAGKTCTSTSPLAPVACRVAISIPRCQTGDAAACELAGRVNMSFPIHDVDKGEAGGMLLLRACDLAPARCVELARFVMTRVTKLELAQRLLDVGCMRDRSVCVEAAEIYLEGRAMPKDDALAVVYLDRACASGAGDACAAARGRR